MLKKLSPEQIDTVFAKAKQDSVDRYDSYRRMAADIG